MIGIRPSCGAPPPTVWPKGDSSFTIAPGMIPVASTNLDAVVIMPCNSGGRGLAIVFSLFVRSRAMVASLNSSGYDLRPPILWIRRMDIPARPIITRCRPTEPAEGSPLLYRSEPQPKSWRCSKGFGQDYWIARVFAAKPSLISEGTRMSAVACGISSSTLTIFAEFLAIRMANSAARER